MKQSAGGRIGELAEAKFKEYRAALCAEARLLLGSENEILEVVLLRAVIQYLDEREAAAELERRKERVALALKLLVPNSGASFAINALLELAGLKYRASHYTSVKTARAAVEAEARGAGLLE